MTTTQTIADPRPLYRDAVTWVAGLAAGVPADRMDGPTPCDEFDVRALLGHLVTTVRKVHGFARGADTSAVPHVSTGIADDALATAYAADADAACTAWSDDALLEVVVRAPWGEVPGRQVLWGHLNEALVHGWDLAVATGQDPEADPALAAAALEWAGANLPAQGREQFPFADPAQPAADAGPTERLANWSGHRR